MIASASASANPIRFGQVEVLPQQRQLRVNGAPAALGARAFDLLLALIEQRDRVVTKDELLDRVWPGLVVEEGNLKVQVSNLRKLIGARAIATIPARGYRFALSLDDDDAPALTATSNAKRVPDAGLPSFGGALIGRNDDLAALGQLLRQGRLVTLLGVGGIGKTRLALAAAQAAWVHSGAQVVWVDLA